MKKLLAILLISVMCLSLAACGSNNTEGTSENGQTNESSTNESTSSEYVTEKNYIAGTELAIPDRVTHDFKCTRMEFEGEGETDKYDLHITVYYETTEQANAAVEEYYKYCNKNNYKDEAGNHIHLPYSLGDTVGDHFDFYVEFAGSANSTASNTEILTLEDWFAAHPDDLTGMAGADENTEVSVQENTLILKYDLSKTEGFTAETVKSDTMKQALEKALLAAQETFVADIEGIETKTGISDINYTVIYTYEDDPVVSATFTRTGVVEDSLGE